MSQESCKKCLRFECDSRWITPHHPRRVDPCGSGPTDQGASDRAGGATSVGPRTATVSAVATSSDESPTNDRDKVEGASEIDEGRIDQGDSNQSDIENGLFIAVRPDGIIAAQGTGVERFFEHAQRIVGSPRVAQATQMISALGSGIDAVPGVGEDAPTLMQFSQRALGLLRERGMLPDTDGLFQQLDTSRFDAPDWLVAPSGADLLQLQTAAVGIALHTSVKSLADAVQRVENRLDEVRDLVRAGQVGEVLGHHRVLRQRLAMIDGANSNGLGDTDWSAVAHLHPHIVSGLERTRFFIRSRMGMTEPGRMVRSRVEAAQRLVDAQLDDALGLLATSEHNLAGWQRLRLDRVMRTEPGHLDAVVADMESSLALHRAEDEALIADLVDMMERLMEPTGLEGLEVLQRMRLIRLVEQIHSATATFARRRSIPMPALSTGELPTWRDSAGLVASKARDGGKWVFGLARRGGRRALPSRRSDPPPPDPSQRRPD